ncbi:hypothetical protein ACE14D_04425 [Streptomyces sp. Act-28]
MKRHLAVLLPFSLLVSCALLQPPDKREAVHVTKAEVVGAWHDSQGGELRLGADGEFFAKKLLLVDGQDDLEGSPVWSGRAGSWVHYEESESSGVLLFLDAGETITFEAVSRDGKVVLSNWVNEGVYYEFTRKGLVVTLKEGLSAQSIPQ